MLSLGGSRGSCNLVVVARSQAIWEVWLTKCLKSGVGGRAGGVGEGCGGVTCGVESASDRLVGEVRREEPMGCLLGSGSWSCGGSGGCCWCCSW